MLRAFGLQLAIQINKQRELRAEGPSIHQCLTGRRSVQDRIIYAWTALPVWGMLNIW